MKRIWLGVALGTVTGAAVATLYLRRRTERARRAWWAWEPDGD